MSPVDLILLSTNTATTTTTTTTTNNNNNNYNTRFFGEKIQMPVADPFKSHELYLCQIQSSGYTQYFLQITNVFIVLSVTFRFTRDFVQKPDAS